MTSPSLESPDASPATRKPLQVAALTVWTDGGPEILSAHELETRTREARALGGPAWLDLHLDTDVDQWLEPWDALDAEDADWDPVWRAVSAAGLVPPGSDRQPDEQLILSHLHVVNEYGVLRWLTGRTNADGAAPLVMPLVGFIPASSLDTRNGASAPSLEFVLLRVNLAVVGDWLVTIRLTDRLCSGCRHQPAGHRLRADEYYALPNLSVFNRFLPTDGMPSATDLGDAVASYLAATCSTAPASARERLREIERDFVQAALHAADDEAIADCHAEMLAIRATLETIEEELLRLSQRLWDVESPPDSLERARHRYGAALQQLESVDAEIRWASDAATNQLTSRRLVEERAAELGARDRQKTLERVIAGLGTALVIAALVPSLFGESAKLPNPNQVGDFIGMVLMMLGTSGVVFWALIWVLKTSSAPSTEQPEGRRRWVTLAAALNLAAALTIVAGVLVLLFA